MNTTNATEFTRAQPRLLGLCVIAGHLKREVHRPGPFYPGFGSKRRRECDDLGSK